MMQVYFDSNNHAAVSQGLCYHIVTQLYFKLQPSSPLSESREQAEAQTERRSLLVPRKIKDSLPG